MSRKEVVMSKSKKKDRPSNSEMIQLALVIIELLKVIHLFFFE